MVLYAGIVLGRALCHVVLAGVDLLLALVELARGPGLDARAELVLPGHLALDLAHAVHARTDAGMLLGIAEIRHLAQPEQIAELGGDHRALGVAEGRARQQCRAHRRRVSRPTASG